MPLTESSPTSEIDTHKWRNCDLVDELAILNVTPISAFMNKVVEPWLDTLNAEEEGRKADLSSSDYLRHWNLHQTREIRQISLQNFCLSIDGMFERELRAWLKSALYQLLSADSKRDESGWLKVIRTGDLDKLSGLLQEHRKIGLSAFPAYPVLRLMKTVANICRHGEGRSVAELSQYYPHFWSLCTVANKPSTGWVSDDQALYSSLILPAKILSDFFDAVKQFWTDVRYIFLNSGGGSLPRDKRNQELDDLRKMRWAYARKIAGDPIFKRSVVV
ncbi:hypothetical protein ABH944_007422 [Caballeronia udeis]|uniref:Uncharacterized protein n=1 Tax=Caballeronia udeis TaxID=1232866 RepID=A0ABW8MXG6_9BURK